MKTKKTPNNPIINKFKELQNLSALSNLKTINTRVIASKIQLYNPILLSSFLFSKDSTRVFFDLIRFFLAKKNLIKSKNTLVESFENKNELSNIGLYSWILLAITLVLIVFKLDNALKFWSSLNLFIIGLLGVFLVFMWIGTDHNATKMNFNLLWASPFHFILIFCLIRENWNNFTYWYLILSLLLIFTTILFWFTLTQEFNSFVKPVIIELVIIYYYYFKKCGFQINLGKTNG